MEVLRSPANPRIRHAARLRTGRYRRRSGQFVVDGLREIQRAVAAGVRPVELFLQTQQSERLRQQHADLLAAPQLAHCQTLVAPAAFEKLAYGERNEGAVAVFETPSRTLEELRLPPSPLLLIADGVEKPGNLGAILRSADAAGVDAVLCSDCATDLFHPNVIRASTATVFTLPAAACSGEAARSFLAAHGIQVVAARVDASATMWQADLGGAVALLVGAEDRGLGPQWQSQAIRIPMAGRADSLNVSVAAAVLAFEARRQRR